MPSAEARIGEAGPEDVLSIVGLSDALSREDAGSRRGPTTNLEWAMHRVVQADAVPVTRMQIALECQRDRARTEPRGRWAA